MTVVNTCDSLTDWSTTNGVDALDPADKQEGTNSIQTTGFAVPALTIEEQYDPAGTWDWSTYDHLTFWFKTEERSDIQFRIWSGANPNVGYIAWNRQFVQQVKAVDTWYEVKLYLDDYDLSDGALNLAAVDGLVIKVWQTNPATSFHVDYIRIDTYDPVKVKIGSVTGLDYVSDDVVEAETWRDSLSGIGRWQLILENTDNKWGGDFLPDEATEIRFNGVLMMLGYVDDVVPFLEASGVYKNRIKVLGRDYGMDLAQLYYTKSYGIDPGTGVTWLADDIVDDVLNLSGSEITYASGSVAPPIEYEFNRDYLADGFKEICKLVDYDFYVEDVAARTLHFFDVGDGNEYLDGGGGRPDVDLLSVSGSANNNILRLERGEKIGFSIKNYIEAHAGGLQDHWTDLNASDWSSAAAAACTLTDETTIFLIGTGKGAIRATATGATNLIMDLDFSGTLYGRTTIDMSERNQGSYACWKHYVSDGIVMKACRIRLIDNTGCQIEYYKSKGIANCSECTDDNQNDLWRVVVFPYGEGLEIKPIASLSSDYWRYCPGSAAPFDWSNIEVIRFISDPIFGWPRNAPDYFIIDGLNIPTVEVFSIEEDLVSQASYGKRMLSIYRPDIKNQIELDAYALDQKEKHKDPLETIKITARGNTDTRYAGQSLQVQAPDHGITALRRYRIVKLHHKLVKNSGESEVPGYTFLTDYDLIRHVINPTQVVDPNRFVVYGSSIDATIRDMRDKLIRLTKLSPVSSSGGAGGGGGGAGVVPYYISGNDIVFYDTGPAYAMLRPETTGAIDLGSNAIQWGDIWGTVHYSDLYMSDLDCPRCGEPFKQTDTLALTVLEVTENENKLSEPYREIRCVPAHTRCPLLPRLKRWFYKLMHRETNEETVYE